MSWTHNACEPCYQEIHPNRTPFKLRMLEVEKCCFCHLENEDGIFVRFDPKLMFCEHPKEE